MPTLLSINNYYYYRGGAETVFLEQNKLLSESGWKVVPFAMQHPNNLPSEWQHYFVDEIEFGGHYSLPQKLARTAKVIYSHEASRKISTLIDEVQPNVCHAHNIYHHISPSVLHVLRKREIPTVLTLHDLKIACPAYNMLAPDGVCERCRNGRVHNVVTQRCIKNSLVLSTVVMLEAVTHRLLRTYTDCVNRFIVPSRFYIDKLVEWGFPRQLFSYVPNFVDAKQYRPNFSAGDQFVFFGRVSREKGLATLIKAAAQAGCSLSIVGTGPQLDDMRTLARDLGVVATFHGYLKGAALHEVIRTARAVVLPSEWYENAPMSVLEAYALGKPVIGADIGGIPELITAGETGEKFVSGNVDSLAGMLQKMMRADSIAIEQMGRHARHIVETGFTADLYRERLLEIYAGLGVKTDRTWKVNTHTAREVV